MCYHIAIHNTREEIEERFQVIFPGDLNHEPRYHVSAFELPYVPIIPSKAPGRITLSQWGLIPHWSKDRDFANQIRMKTCNARMEGILDKPSYRTAIKEGRCLVPARGFYEWHTHQGKKYPFYIHYSNNNIFAFAGIYDKWVDKFTGEVMNTFSIITTRANPLMAKIHNSKKRMPVILSHLNEKKWLDSSLPTQDILPLLHPDESDLMNAYPVSKKFLQRDDKRNTPESITPFKYDELDHLAI